jgi:hypothetical protein
MPARFTVIPPPSYIPFIPNLLDPEIREYHRLPTREEAHALCEAILPYMFKNEGNRIEHPTVSGVFPMELAQGMIRQFRPMVRDNTRMNVVTRTAFLADIFILGTIMASSVEKAQVPLLEIKGEEAMRAFEAVKEFSRNASMADNAKRAIYTFLATLIGIEDPKILWTHVKTIPEWRKFWRWQANSSGVDLGLPSGRDNFAIVPMCESQGANYPLNVAAVFNVRCGSTPTHGWSHVGVFGAAHTHMNRRFAYVPHHIPVVDSSGGNTGSSSTRSGNNYPASELIRLPSIFDVYKAICHWGNKEEWVTHLLGNNTKALYLYGDPELDTKKSTSEIMRLHHEKIEIAYDNYEIFYNYNQCSPFENHLQYTDTIGFSDHARDVLNRLQITEQDFSDALASGNYLELFDPCISGSTNLPHAWRALFRRSEPEVPDPEQITEQEEESEQTQVISSINEPSPF